MFHSTRIRNSSIRQLQRDVCRARFDDPSERSRWVADAATNGCAGGRCVGGVWLAVAILLGASFAVAQDQEVGPSAAGLPAKEVDPSNPQAFKEDGQLESLLQRLRLTDLHMTHLESQVNRLQGDAQVATAKRLANLYADQLLTANEEKQADLNGRIAKLIELAPSASTPELSVVLLQSRFQEAEKDALQWLNERDEDAQRRVQPVLADLAPKLRDRHANLKNTLSALEAKLDGTELGRAEMEALESKLNQSTVLTLRAAFLGGWANYYDGILNQSPRSLVAAKALFESLLALDEEGARATPEWLGIAVPAKARSLIGLAIVEIALENSTLADQYFEVLLNPVVQPEIRDQVGQWHVRGMLNVDKREMGLKTARHYIDGYSTESTPGKAQLCASLIQAAYRQGEGGPQRDEEMGMLGIHGLARIGEFKLLRQLLEKHEIRLENPSGFFLQWVAAQQQMRAADESKAPEEYLAAAEAFAEALKSDLSKAGQTSIAQCRNEYAWSLYHAKQWRPAAAEYERAATILGALGESEAAVKAAWMGCVALQQAAKVDAKLTKLAEDGLAQLAKDFPDSEYARKARYQLAKMKGSSGDSLSALENVAASDPNYLNARYDLCMLRHQRWVDSRGTPDEPREAAAVIRVVDTYLALPGDKLSERRFRAAILGVEAAVDGRPTQPAARTRLLALATTLVPEVRDANLLASFHYHSLRQSFAAGDQAQAETHANWLRDNPAGKKYEETALVILAKAADTAMQQSTGEKRIEWLKKSYDIYRRLSASLGDDVESISQSRNAQVALYKAADCQLQLGDSEEAAKRFDRLLEVSPKNRQFIRGAAAAHFHAKHYELALDHWRDLVRAAKETEAEWYEAKYHQIACLAEIRPDTAVKVFQQFTLLHPAPPAAWKAKFTSLGTRLNGRAP